MIRWYEEDGVHYGWRVDQDMREEEASFLVKENFDHVGTWSGWLIGGYEERECVTRDLSSVHEAKSVLEELEAVKS